MVDWQEVTEGAYEGRDVLKHMTRTPTKNTGRGLLCEAPVDIMEAWKAKYPCYSFYYISIMAGRQKVLGESLQRKAFILCERKQIGNNKEL